MPVASSLVALVLAVSTWAWVVVVLSIVGTAVVLAVLFRQWYPRGMASDQPADERHPQGPTGAAYPPGSRPGGPGAEGMNVPEPGQITPGPSEQPPHEQPPDEQPPLEERPG